VRIIFFGTANISKAYLESLYNNKHEILCVTMPDKPAARGQKLTAPAVKVFAQENNILFIQPEKFTAEVVEKLKSFKAEAGIAVAYGKIIPRAVFALPKFKTFNIHFSLLPKYRGAAPVQYALLNGETETGVTSFYLDDALDTGDILMQEKYPIDIKDTAESLFQKLIPLGIEIMNSTLSKFAVGDTKATPQIGKPTFAYTLKKEDGLIDWKQNAADVYNKVRAFYPWPGAYSFFVTGKLDGRRIKFIEAEIVETNTVNDEAGEIFAFEKNKGFTVVCAKGKILFTKIQPENKSVMGAWDFIQGGQLKEGDCLGLKGE